MSDRLLSDSLAALAFPPLDAPSLLSATAAGFLPAWGSGNGVPSICSPMACSTTSRANCMKSRSERSVCPCRWSFRRPFGLAGVLAHVDLAKMLSEHAVDKKPEKIRYCGSMRTLHPCTPSIGLSTGCRLRQTRFRDGEFPRHQFPTGRGRIPDLWKSY